MLDPAPENALPSPVARLRAVLDSPRIAVVPGCHDAMGARLIARAGLPATFLSGYAVSAARLGLPAAWLISYREMLDAKREVCADRVLLLGSTLLNVVLRAQQEALALIAAGAHPGPDRLLPFEDLYDRVGFNAYDAMEKC